MTIHLGDVPASGTLYIPFSTYNQNGASITMSGLAVTDIEIYKNGSTTQRSSDSGYTLLDTDGIDFDGITGIHGFSVDLSDNTDAGFYAVGSFYWVVVSSITVNSQTVNFIAATFRIVAAESVTGKPKVDVDAFGGVAGTFSIGRPEVNTTHIAGSAVSTSSAQIGVNVVNAAGTAWNSGAIGESTLATDTITAAKIAADAIGASELAADAATEIGTAVWASGTRTLSALDEDTTTLDLDATIRAAVGLASANLDTQLSAIDDFIDTEVAAIKAKTDNLPSDPADASDISTAFSAVNAALTTIDDFLDTEVAAIKAKTDQLTFTTVNRLDAQVFGVEADAISASALATAAANEIADAILDRADAIETGVTPRGLLRLVGAILAGKVSGAGSGTEIFRNTVADSKDRIIASVDNNGNRTAITTDMT